MWHCGLWTNNKPLAGEPLETGPTYLSHRSFRTGQLWQGTSHRNSQPAYKNFLGAAAQNILHWFWVKQCKGLRVMIFSHFSFFSSLVLSLSRKYAADRYCDSIHSIRSENASVIFYLYTELIVWLFQILDPCLAFMVLTPKVSLFHLCHLSTVSLSKLSHGNCFGFQSPFLFCALVHWKFN